MSPNFVDNVGHHFGPTSNGKFYVSLNYHRKSGNPQKAIWDVSPDYEFETFKEADEKDWYDTSDSYWGIRDDGRAVLGSRGERLCKFPNPSNPNDEWHGYPVSPLERGPADAPPKALVDHWHQQQVISKTTHRRIMQKKI